MGHIETRKAVTVRTSYAARDWWYEFDRLPVMADERRVQTTIRKLQASFTKVAKDWDEEMNSEWVVRLFFAGKMVLGASLMAQSLKYARAQNLRPVISYLEYYAVLYSLRAVIMADPNCAWKSGGLMMAPHSTTIKAACHRVGTFVPDPPGKIKTAVLHVKAARELISYRAPTSGDRFPQLDFDVLTHCRLFLEVAQLQSELLESVLENEGVTGHELDPDTVRSLYEVELDGRYFFGDEDLYRIGYLARKHPYPANIQHILTGGHVEDFFASWCADQEDAGRFDPNKDWQIVFDLQ